MALVLPDAAPLLGQGAYALYGNMSALFGFGWCLTGDTTHIVYRDENDGVFNSLVPTGIADDGDATISIDQQYLFTEGQTDKYSLYLKGEGADGSTTITDSSPTGHTVTPVADAQIDTAQFKFGSASIKFDGVGDSLSIGDHADFDLGATDFGIDMWVRYAVLPAAPGIDLYLQALAGDNIELAYNGPTDTLSFFVDDGGLSLVAMTTAALSLAINTWYHIAVERVGSVWTIYLDGVSKATDTAAITVPNVGAIVEINSGTAECWIDHLRVIKGSAKWTWRYLRRGTSPAGSISGASNETRVTVDVAGNIFFEAGNDPTGLTLELTTDGAITLDWRYDETDQPAVPTGFKMYRLVSGVYTYQDSTPFVSGINRYTYTSGSYANGTSQDWTVRTYRTVGSVDYEQENADNVTGNSDAAAPAAVTSLTVA